MKEAKALATTPSGVGARLVSNSRWNFIAFSVSLVINFATIPIVISLIGLDAFGTAGLVSAIYAPFMLVGTVLGQAIVKELSPLIAIGSFEGAARVLSASLVLCVVGCVFVVVLLTLVGGSSIPLFGMQGNAAVNWSLAFFIAGLGWSSQQAIFVLQATFAAAQRYYLLALNGILTAVISAISIVIGSMLLPGYLGLLIGTSTGLIISLLMWVVLVRYGMPALFPLPRFRRLEIRTITDFGKWQGGSHFIGAVGNQVDRYVLGALAPLTVVGQYNVAMRLQEVVHMGLLKVTEVLFPHFSVTANEPIERRASFYIKASWILNVLGAAALAPLIPLSNELITLWVSKEAAQGGALMLCSLATAGILGCGVNVYYFFAIGTGQGSRIAKITIAHAMLTIFLTVFLICYLGSSAAGVGYLIANTIRLCVTLWYSSKYFSPAVGMRKQIECTMPPLITGLLLAWTLAQAGWLSPLGWVQLIICYVLMACALAFISIMATSLTGNGRELVKESMLALRSILIQRN